jgi:hypothetical protein
LVVVPFEQKVPWPSRRTEVIHITDSVHYCK